MTNVKDNKKAKKKVNKKSKQNHLTQNIDLSEWLSENGMPKENTKKEENQYD